MKRWIVPVTTVSMIIGVLLSVQYRSQADARRLMPSRRVEDLVVMLKSTEKANQQMLEQVAVLQQQLNKTRGVAPASGDMAPGAYPTLSGSGLLVTVTESGAENKMEDGTSAVLHAEDLLKLVNQLRAGGAEAIAVNGHRLTEMSEVITAGQHIVVNKVALAAPYHLVAIGPADDMKDALALHGGVVEYLQFYGIEVTARPEDPVVVPAAKSLLPLRFAKPAKPPDP